MLETRPSIPCPFPKYNTLAIAARPNRVCGKDADIAVKLNTLVPFCLEHAIYIAVRKMIHTLPKPQPKFPDDLIDELLLAKLEAVEESNSHDRNRALRDLYHFYAENYRQCPVPA